MNVTITARKKWYQTGLRFECIRCGECCSGEPGYVWVTKEEIRRISEFLGRTDGWLDKKHLRRAVDAWPDDLRDEGDYRVRAPEGVVWFETARELFSLKKEADELIAAQNP